MRSRYSALFERMASADPDARDFAFDEVLLDRERALPALIEGYHKYRDQPDLRFMLVQLMGFTNVRAAVPAVVAALEDHDPYIRAEAWRALEDLLAL